MRDHFALLAAVVREHNGSVVKTIGDAVMAAFADPVDAVAAALAVQARLDGFNRGDGPAITIKLGVHCGPCIAVTLNDRLDYFGSTVNLAARLQSESAGGDIVLSAEVLADPRVRALLRGQTPVEESAALKGFGQRVAFYRLISPVPAGVRSEDPGDRPGEPGRELRRGILEVEVDLIGGAHHARLIALPVMHLGGREDAPAAAALGQVLRHALGDHDPFARPFRDLHVGDDAVGDVLDERVGDRGGGRAGHGAGDHHLGLVARRPPDRGAPGTPDQRAAEALGERTFGCGLRGPADLKDVRLQQEVSVVRDRRPRDNRARRAPP